MNKLALSVAFAKSLLLHRYECNVSFDCGALSSCMTGPVAYWKHVHEPGELGSSDFTITRLKSF